MKVTTKDNKNGSYFGFNRNILFTGLTSFLTDTSVKMVYSVMPMFLISIGASKTSLALIEGVAESTSALIKAVSGFWSDKIGKNKPFM
ncbi:MAG: yceE, partial [Bacteroidetes bacterium]|nr:yceE [Bacteroidota bacterium]